jgi:ketosteroid isomerase-like protein
MPTEAEHQIAAAENRLRKAMLASDVEVLDELISSDLIFTDLMGHLCSKEQDLEIHRSGILKFQTLEPSERQLKVYGEFAAVSVRMKVSSIYDGLPADGDFRFTRIWQLKEGNGWQIVAGHVSAVQ